MLSPILKQIQIQEKNTAEGFFQDPSSQKDVALCETVNMHPNRYLIKVTNANDEWLLAWILQGLLQEWGSSQAQNAEDCKSVAVQMCRICKAVRTFVEKQHSGKG